MDDPSKMYVVELWTLFTVCSASERRREVLLKGEQDIKCRRLFVY